MTNVMYVIALVGIGLLAFFLGAKLTGHWGSKSQTPTSTSIITSFRTIAELATLEYVTEGTADISEKKVSLIFARWKKGLLRYTAKIKVGFDMEQAKYNIDDVKRMIRIALPKPKVIACEIYNKKFYKLPLESAENVRMKIDIIEDFTSSEILGLEEIAKKTALKTLDDFGILDSYLGKMKLIVREVLSPQLPEHTVELIVSETESSQSVPKVLEVKRADDQISDLRKQ